MVLGSNCSRDTDSLETVLYEHNHYLASEKKLKSLGPEFASGDASTCTGEISDCNFHLHNEHSGHCFPYQ